MTDIVERLRSSTSLSCGPLHWKAADEIEKLREESQHRLEMLQRQKAEIERLKAQYQNQIKTLAISLLEDIKRRALEGKL